MLVIITVSFNICFPYDCEKSKWKKMKQLCEEKIQNVLIPFVAKEQIPISGSIREEILSYCAKIPRIINKRYISNTIYIFSWILQNMQNEKIIIERITGKTSI